jgi:hypothetical protein
VYKGESEVEGVVFPRRMQGIVDHVSLRLPVKSVQFQQAAARQIACMAGERLIPPTPGRKGCMTSFSTSSMRAEQGMQVEEVKECDNQAFWWIAAQTCRKACGRKGLVGERRESVPGQMSHKAKMQKTANRKASPKSCREEMRDGEDCGWKCESDVSQPVSDLRI